jgi:hypothetical protein
VVPERDLGRADLRGEPIQRTPAQPGAQRARRRVDVEDLLDRLPDVRVLDVQLPPARGARLGELVVLVALVAGVDVHRDQREVDRGPLLQDVEDLDERPAVLAARQADHDPIAVLDQTVLGDRLGDLLGDPGFEVRGVGHVAAHSASRRKLQKSKRETL